MDQNLAYLKLINVPCIFDIGTLASDPTTEFLSLTMVDEKTYKIEMEEYLMGG